MNHTSKTIHSKIKNKVIYVKLFNKMLFLHKASIIEHIQKPPGNLIPELQMVLVGYHGNKTPGATLFIALARRHLGSGSKFSFSPK